MLIKWILHCYSNYWTYILVDTLGLYLMWAWQLPQMSIANSGGCRYAIWGGWLMSGMGVASQGHRIVGVCKTILTQLGQSSWGLLVTFLPAWHSGQQGKLMSDCLLRVEPILSQDSASECVCVSLQSLNNKYYYLQACKNMMISSLSLNLFLCICLFLSI